MSFQTSLTDSQKKESDRFRMTWGSLYDGRMYSASTDERTLKLLTLYGVHYVLTMKYFFQISFYYMK